jgi:hypothetical protein
MPGKVRNWQKGSTGRASGDATFTFKRRSKKGTLAYNVRCTHDRKSKACEVAVSLMQKAQANLASVPDDNGRKRKIVKRGDAKED